MEFLTQLWLPIILSAVAVFFLSFLFWAVLPFHRKDHRRLPDEARFTELVRSAEIPPGNYFFPYCASREQERDPEYLKRVTEGPTGEISIWGKVSMGRNMAVTFLTTLVISTIIAYLSWTTLGAGESFLEVFRIAGTAGVLAYSFGFISRDVWFSAYPRTILLKMLDGLFYGLTMGLIFALLWPGA